MEKTFVAATQFLAFLVLTLDMVYDLWKGVAGLHIAIEAIVTVCMGFVVFNSLLSYFEQEKLNSVRMEQEIESMRKQAETWKDEAKHYLEGLVNKIDQQFNTWGLSAAEKDIALLLIKGYSIREIATLRDTSEKTIKQQNFSIYKKSKLTGRSELAAFFLEDLLLPSSTSISKAV